MICTFSCKEFVNYNDRYSTPYSIVNPTNQENPYDSAGYWHNQGLDYIISNKNNFTCDSNDLKGLIRQYVSDFACESNYDIPINNCSDSIESIFNKFWSNDRYLNVDEILDYHQVDSTVKTNTYTIINLIKLYNGFNTSNIIDTIKNFENIVLNNLNLNLTQRRTILMASSIARYSLSYWNEVFQDTTNDWRGGFIDCQTGRSKKINDIILFFEGYSDVEKTIAVGVADVVGFVSTRSVWGGLTFSAVTAVVAWWDDIIDALESFWDWLF